MCLIFSLILLPWVSFLNAFTSQKLGNNNNLHKKRRTELCTANVSTTNGLPQVKVRVSHLEILMSCGTSSVNWVVDATCEDNMSNYSMTEWSHSIHITVKVFNVHTFREERAFCSVFMDSPLPEKDCGWKVECRYFSTSSAINHPFKMVVQFLLKLF